MISMMPNMPPGVLAFTASGRVTGEDYEEILAPAIDRMLAEHDTVRVLYHLGPDFKRFTTTALWDDTRIGLHHWSDFERIAVVTDVGWLLKTVKGLGRAIPDRIRAFENVQMDEARDWISE
jgi:hypothetical protein